LKGTIKTNKKVGTILKCKGKNDRLAYTPLSSKVSRFSKTFLLDMAIISVLWMKTRTFLPASERPSYFDQVDQSQEGLN